MKRDSQSRPDGFDFGVDFPISPFERVASPLDGLFHFPATHFLPIQFFRQVLAEFDPVSLLTVVATAPLGSHVAPP